MDEINKKLVKKSAIVIADQIVSSTPFLNVAWGLAKAFLGTGIEMRQERALEFIEIIKDNPKIFIQDTLKEKTFQDGFVYILEKYIRERNESKRIVLKNIFIRFTKSNDKKNYPLEKMIHTSNQLSENDINILRNLINEQTLGNNKIIKYGRDDDVIVINNLIHAGLLKDITSPQMGHGNGLLVKISDFGKEFIEYIIK